MASIINITDPSGNFENNIEPTWAQASDESVLPAPSQHTVTNGTGNINGRSSHLADIFSADKLGLDDYDPKATFVAFMSGDKTLALGATPTDGAGQYFGPSIGVGHLTYTNSPNLSEVDVVSLNIPNPYVPDISNGAQTASDYKAVFEASHPGTQNSYPPAGATPSLELTTENNLDLNAGGETPTLSPHNTATRLGGWMHDTSMEYGRWSTDSAE